MKTFEEALNESTTAILGMKFVISSSIDGRDIIVQFIPDSKTLDKFSKNEQVEAITDLLNKKVPFLEGLYFKSGHPGAGLVFVLSPFDIARNIEKAIK